MDITVTDIVTKAGVGRASFYRNYNSVNEIIDDIVDERTSEFIDEIYPVITGSDERKWRDLLFQLFYGFPKRHIQRDALLQQNAGVWFARMNGRFQTVINQIKADTLEDRYAAFGKMGLISNIIKKWMEDGMKESPEEMVNYIMSFILLF